MNTWLKSKAFWINILAIIAVVIQYLLTNGIAKQWATYEGIALALITAITTQIQGNAAAKLKTQLVELNKKIEGYIAQIALYNKQGK
jgi:hypothetical protein